MPLKEPNYEQRLKLSQFLGTVGTAHVLEHWGNLEAVFGSVSKIIVMVMDDNIEPDLCGEVNDDGKVSEERA